MGITTIADLRHVSVDLLMTRFGKWGRAMQERAWGIDNRAVHTDHVRKSISTERTFAENIRKVEEIDEIVGKMAGKRSPAGSKTASSPPPRSSSRYATRTSRPRRDRTPSRTHLDASTIAAVARELVRRTEAAKRSVRLLGVGVSNLVPAELGQRTLFDE